MNQLHRRAKRAGLEAVKFTLRVLIRSLHLPGIAHGCKIFVLLERANRKSWTSPHPYCVSTASVEQRYHDELLWEQESLNVPVTLYRNSKGGYQSKPFKLKIMSVPEEGKGDENEFGESRVSDLVDNAQLASMTLDASTFVILDQHEAPDVIRVSAKANKSAIPTASIQVSVACVYERDSLPDQEDDAMTMTGSVATHNTANGGWSTYEQDLTGFDEAKLDSWDGSSAKGRNMLLWSGSSARWWRSKGTSARSKAHGSSESVRPFLRGESTMECVTESPDSKSGEVEENEEDEEDDAMGGRVRRRSVQSGLAKRLTSGLSTFARSATSTFQGLSSAEVVRGREDAAARSTPAGRFLVSLGLDHAVGPLVVEGEIQNMAQLQAIRPEDFSFIAARASLRPAEASKLRRALGIPNVSDPQAQDAASRVPPKQLVGAWIEVEGVGPGLVTKFKPCFNRIVYHSHHEVDFLGGEYLSTSARMQLARLSASTTGASLLACMPSSQDSSGGLQRVPLLLRRRKLGRWNGGVRFEIVPNPEEEGLVHLIRPNNSSVLVAVDGAATKWQDDVNATFIPSKTFEGSKTGMVFKNGNKGVGYYTDMR